MIERIISGGQTGVDRAALDAAIACGVPHGGWCPHGRRAEDGPIAPCYELTETTSRKYHVRTRQNVLEADGTLILHRGPLTGGTALTRKIAEQVGRPLLTIDLSQGTNAAAIRAIRAWLQRHTIRTLNVAGPRESTCPQIGDQARRLVQSLLKSQRASPTSKPPRIG